MTSVPANFTAGLVVLRGVGSLIGVRVTCFSKAFSPNGEQRISGPRVDHRFNYGASLLLGCSSSMKDETYNQPSSVVAEEGKVLVDGPDGVDVALTPDAAFETADRLTDAAAKAAGENRTKKFDHRPK